MVLIHISKWVINLIPLHRVQLLMHNSIRETLLTGVVFLS
nr:MAG TPA: hypothetical protein [Caudoviricetes sp.]